MTPYVVSILFFKSGHPLIQKNQYITWVSDGKPSWTINAGGIGPEPSVEISARVVPQEPMVLLSYDLNTFPTEKRSST
jgi:hypothetical protein